MGTRREEPIRIEVKVNKQSTSHPGEVAYRAQASMQFYGGPGGDEDDSGAVFFVTAAETPQLATEKLARLFRSHAAWVDGAGTTKLVSEEAEHEVLPLPIAATEEDLALYEAIQHLFDLQTGKQGGTSQEVMVHEVNEIARRLPNETKLQLLTRMAASLVSERAIRAGMTLKDVEAFIKWIEEDLGWDLAEMNEEHKEDTPEY